MRRGRAHSIVAALLLSAAAVGCGDEPATPVAEGGLADLEADGIVYSMDDYLETDGIRSGRIRADSAYVYNDSSIVHLFSVDMNLYHDDGRERATVTARRATMNQRTDEMVARGDVVVQMAASPERIETPELYYDPGRNEIWSDSATTRILPSGRTTRGTCFRATLELENVSICNPRGAVGLPPGSSTEPRRGGGSGGQASPALRPGGPAARPPAGGTPPDPRARPDTAGSGGGTEASPAEPDAGGALPDDGDAGG